MALLVLAVLAMWCCCCSSGSCQGMVGAAANALEGWVPAKLLLLLTGCCCLGQKLGVEVVLLPKNILNRVTEERRVAVAMVLGCV